ncbi:hypothetical protein D5086_022859 [Populus alba]|uniref:Uncharacterized protein n=1 Tax=Populus alba TaxID=43335 RepID=A0ACC4B9Z0_POPAL
MRKQKLGVCLALGVICLLDRMLLLKTNNPSHAAKKTQGRQHGKISFTHFSLVYALCDKWSYSSLRDSVEWRIYAFLVRIWLIEMFTSKTTFIHSFGALSSNFMVKAANI